MTALAPLEAQSVDVEQALLGSALVDSSAIDHLDGSVTPDDFYDPLHAELFKLMLDARAEGRAFNLALFTSMLGEIAGQSPSGLGMSVGEYLVKLMGVSAGPSFARDFGRRLVDIANFRRLDQSARSLAERARAGVGAPGKMASEVISELDAVVSASLSNNVRPMMVGDAATAAIEASHERRRAGEKAGLPWPLVDLNRATLGLHPGELVIIAARPSMGKSTLGLAVGTHLALAGHGVLLVSLEMGADALAERALSDICYSLGKSVPYIDIRSGAYEQDCDEALTDAYDRLRAAPLLIEQQGGLSVGQIASRARAAALRFENQGRKLRCLVVDHLGLVAASARYAGARHSELGEITSALKSLAKELGIPVVLLCQLNRSVEGRENKRPMLSDLRESGRIEEDADTVMLLYREAYYLERAKETDAEKEMLRQHRLMEVQNELEINIAKQRQGPTKLVTCFVSMPCNAIRDLDRRYS